MRVIHFLKKRYKEIGLILIGQSFASAFVFLASDQSRLNEMTTHLGVFGLVMVVTFFWLEFSLLILSGDYRYEKSAMDSFVRALKWGFPCAVTGILCISPFYAIGEIFSIEPDSVRVLIVIAHTILAPVTLLPAITLLLFGASALNPKRFLRLIEPKLVLLLILSCSYAYGVGYVTTTIFERTSIVHDTLSLLFFQLLIIPVQVYFLFYLSEA